jgi:hypothetical protein
MHLHSPIAVSIKALDHERLRTTTEYSRNYTRPPHLPTRHNDPSVMLTIACARINHEGWPVSRVPGERSLLAGVIIRLRWRPAPMSSASNQKPPNQRPLDQRLQDAAKRAEEELHRLVRFLDDEVVPEVRRNSSSALRAAAVRLQKLAESMDDARTNAKDTPPSGTNPPSTGS